MYIRSQKGFYDNHDPIGIHYLFQLRTGLTPLRGHHHNFLDIPTDLCSCHQGIEHVNHFLFECLHFANHRAVNITSIELRYNLTELANDAEFYRYGHADLTSDDSKKVLSSTIQYIKTPEKFTLA